MPDAALLKDADLEPALAALIAKAPMPAIDTGHVDRATATAVASWLRDHPETSVACQAGLWLLAGDLNHSHTLSQELPTAEGSYWHGIMHRREGDFENAKYWFRRVGQHPVLDELAAEVDALRSQYGPSELPWDELTDAGSVAPRLVDCCRTSRSPAVEEIAWREWQLLFRYCHQSSL
jgi:hypothetical protein